MGNKSKRTALNDIQAELLAMANILASVAGIATDFTFTPAAAAATVCEVTVQARDNAGVALTRPTLLTIWLTDAATGLALTGTAASGTVTAKAASGAIFDTHVAKKALMVQTLADGTFILEITDSAKTAFIIAAQSNEGGVPSISDALITADYGA
jgi:hypothetical protein